MKRLKFIMFLIPYFIVGLNSLSAQKNAVDFYGGYTFVSFKHPTFDQFVETYNAANSADLIKPLTRFGTATGFEVGGQYRLFGIFGNVSYEQISSSVSAELKLNESRNFDFKNHFFIVEFGFSLGDERFSIIPNIGLNAGRETIDCYYIYRDGTISYGQDTRMSGVYSSLALKGDYGLKLHIGLKQGVGILANINYIPKGNLAKFQLEDHSSVKSLGLGMTSSGIPTDYQLFLQTANNYDYPDDKWVTPDFSGLRITLGLCISLDAKK